VQKLNKIQDTSIILPAAVSKRALHALAQGKPLACLTNLVLIQRGLNWALGESVRWSAKNL